MRIAPHATALALAFFALVSAGCGGCGCGGATVYSTLIFKPTSDLTLVSDGSAPVGGGLSVGDTATNLSTRAGLRFGVLAFLPNASTVVSAKLRLQQVTVLGNPYGLLGTIVADHVEFDLTLDAADFGATVLTADLGTLSNTVVLELKELDVTAAVAADVTAGHLTSDFILRFTTAAVANGTLDAAQLEDVEDALASGVQPTLVVSYY